MSHTRSVSCFTGISPETIPLPPSRKPKHPKGQLLATSTTSDPGSISPMSTQPSGSRGHNVPGGFAGDDSSRFEEIAKEPKLEYGNGGGNGGGNGSGDGGNDGNGGDDGDDGEDPGGDGEEGDDESVATDNTQTRLCDALRGLNPQDRVLYDLLAGIAGGLATHNCHSAQPPPVKTPKVAIKEPGTFNGKDPLKLNNFIFQCRIYFDANPHQFPTNHTKVSFALSYLTGKAQTWFQTLLEDTPDWNVIPWYNDWDLFVEELTSNFGAVDPLAEAAEEIEHLCMATTEHINKYNVSFAHLAGRLHWPDSVLVYRYYHGLPDRIQDALSALPNGKPSTMREMWEQVMHIDNRYWERQRERNRATKQSGSKETTSQDKGKGKGSNSNANNQQSSSGSNNSKPGKTPNSNSNSNSNSKSISNSNAQSSSSSSNPLVNVLGKTVNLLRKNANVARTRTSACSAAVPGIQLTTAPRRRLGNLIPLRTNQRDVRQTLIPRVGDRVDNLCAPESIRLNASALSDPSSLRIPLSSPDFPSLSEFSALLDSGSTHCFIQGSLVRKHGIPTFPVPPVKLHLFDGTSNSFISEIAKLPVLFPTGESMTLSFYVTLLDLQCSVVLGHDWLSCYNLLIDWVTGRITFCSTTIAVPPFLRALSSLDTVPQTSASASITEELSDSPSRPDIRLINAAAFAHASRLPGSHCFALNLHSVVAAATAISESPVDLSAIPDEYHDFADVFSKKRADTLPPHWRYDLKIDLEDGTLPPIGPIYSLSRTELDALHNFIDENLSIGFIRPATSPHGTPVLFVKKKDGSLRLCVDFRGLNRISRKDRYPLPLISDLLDSPHKARIYTKIDLRHAYHLIRIADGDEWKTAFRTRYGSFEWLVMPFGLTNAPAAFQRFMNNIFQDLLDVCATIYLDDILIYSDNPSQHCKHVWEVLRRLREHGLYARADKCEFNSESVEYLGYILSPGGLTMSNDKVKTIQDWPEPRKVKDIQSFLGFANFYRRFIYGYSDIVVPLTRLTRKGTPWNFGSEAREAFKMLKKAFTMAQVLTHWIPDSQIIVETDASDYALATILSTITSDGDIHPIAFHSRTFTAPELNYNTHDKELLTIFEAFGIWRHYLEGASLPIDVVTNQKNLEYFATTRLLTRWQARWSEYLSQFNLVIRFRPGKLGTKPDALTSRWDVYPKGEDKVYASANPHNFRPVFTQEQLISSLRATSLLAPVFRAATIMDLSQLHSNIRSSLSENSIAAQNLASPQGRWTINSDGLLLLDGRIYVPDANDLRLRITQYHHDHITAGHFGQNKTLEIIRRNYTWPAIRDFVKHFCKSCVTCM
ncbi:hypothetical protein Agabi119p4_5155 [Agaricus bisporus var. burnettii]|uniref:Reverse transcriptase domain-containing protein n=1 Tax=Agaricus bisporus var. burnettii TaxID=192524 RepID=A0A8H7KHZ6_AGABI|nr:hypothetical protein Agabi119p4_5155 [Agaricus bisporus var. burnettii]